MSHNARLLRLQRTALETFGSGIRCSTCRAPMPSVPPSVMIGKEGIYEWWGRVPCEECSGLGVRFALPIDEHTGRPTQPVKLVGLDIGAEEWFELHGNKTFGQPWDRFVDLYRPDSTSRTGPSDGEPPTEEPEPGQVFYPPWPFKRMSPYEKFEKLRRR